MAKRAAIYFLLIILLSLLACSQKEKMVKGAELFPWPPPKPSSFCRIPSEFLTKSAGNTYLSDVFTKLDKALELAGYSERKIRTLENGFVIITRIEQYREDGTPALGEKRWETEITPLSLSAPITNFKEYLKAVFYPEVYRFRIILFIVKPGEVNERENPITPNEASNWFSSDRMSDGLDDIANGIYSPDYTCTAFIYEFEKYIVNNDLIPIELSRLLGKTHLEKSKLWQALEKK